MRTDSAERTGRLTYVRKTVLAGLGLVLMATSGASFYRHRHLEEPVVLSPGVTEVKKLSDYFAGVRAMADLYLLDPALSPRFPAPGSPFQGAFSPLKAFLLE